MIQNGRKQMTRTLSAVAMGRIPADTVIQNIKLVNVHTGEIQDGTDIAITQGRIALVGNAGHTIGPDTFVVDGEGLYAAPGFLDGHMHVESSMLTVREYGKAVIAHGTTGIFADPHEIANVLGPKGVTLMMEEAKGVPLHFFVTVPSCVPAVDGFEDNGAVVTVEDIEDFLSQDDVCGLGEMMNIPGVINGDEEIHKKLQATMAQTKTITGHFTAPDLNGALNAYVASGMACCHESVKKEEALAKARLGMYVQVREGSAWKDLTETIRIVTENNIDTRFVQLVSDDAHPHTLVSQGHMDYIIRRAVEEGVNPVTAIQMATINTAQCFHMDRDIGSIAPGKLADIVLLQNLKTVTVKKVWIEGRLVAENGKLALDVPPVSYPVWAKDTMHMKPMAADDFLIPGAVKEDSVLARVIEVGSGQVVTGHGQYRLPVADGYVLGDRAQDIMKVAVVDRHHNTNRMSAGFVKGFSFQNGAAASTVSHDAHNLMVVGDNNRDMAVAANALADCGGGMAVVKEGSVLALVPLPIAGLMCEDDVDTVAEKVKKLDESWKALGCEMVSPFMTMALMALAVIPSLRLTNRGLIDTVRYQFVDVIIP